MQLKRREDRQGEKLIIVILMYTAGRQHYNFSLFVFSNTKYTLQCILGISSAMSVEKFR